MIKYIANAKRINLQMFGIGFYIDYVAMIKANLVS